MQNELKTNKESMERFNKPKEAMKHFDELMKSLNYSNGSKHNALRKENHLEMENEGMKSQRKNQHPIIVEKLVILQIFVEANIVCKILNLSLLVTIFTKRN